MSLYNKAKTIFLASGAAGKPQAKRGNPTGTAHTVKPVEILSNEELVKNGTFLGEDFWTLGENISINADGFAVFDEVDGYHSMSTTEDNRIFKLGRTYKVSFEISDFRGEGPSAALLIQEYPNRNPAIATVESNGKYSFIYRSVGPESGSDVGKDARIIIKNNGAGDSKVSCKISNVSVREVYSKPIDINTKRDTDLSGTRYVAASALIEKGRQNLIRHSNALHADGWGNTQNDPSFYANAIGGQEGYDGTDNAWLIEKTHTNNSYVGGPFFGYNGVYTWSIYAKNQGDKDNGIMMYTPHVQGHFDLVNGTVLTEGGGSTKIEVKIEAVTGSAGDTDRWYRCSVSGRGEIVDYIDDDPDDNSDQETRPRFKVINITGNNEGNGNYNTTGKIFVQNSQFEAGQVATNYIDNDSLTRVVGVGLDEPRYDYLTSDSPCYLLEPPRTNLNEYSEYFDLADFSGSNSLISSNQSKSPEGLMNATYLYGGRNAGAVTHRIFSRGFVTESDTSYTVSFFAKKGSTVNGSKIRCNIRLSNEGIDGVGHADFTLVNGGSFTTNDGSGDVEATMTFYGNGWYRCTVTGVPSTPDVEHKSYLYLLNDSGDSSYIGNDTDYVQIYGWQIERGGYATSYIPTYGSTVTRTQDNTSSSHWNNIDKGLLDLSKSWGVYLSLGKTKMYADQPASIPLFVFYTSGNKESVSLFCNTQNTGTAEDPVYEHGLNFYLLNQGGYVFAKRTMLLMLTSLRCVSLTIT